MKLKKLPGKEKSRTCHSNCNTSQVLPELTPPHYTTLQQWGLQPGEGFVLGLPTCCSAKPSQGKQQKQVLMRLFWGTCNLRETNPASATFTYMCFSKYLQSSCFFLALYFI